MRHCRTIVKLLLLLLAWGAAGATLNVAVAWGCVATTRPFRDGFGVSDSSGFSTSGLGSEVCVSAGLPMRGLFGTDSHYNGITTIDAWRVVGERRIPLKPIWPGFAINTLFYAGVLWALFCGPFALRRMIRRRRGQCPQCAYPIGQSPVCTECGAGLCGVTQAMAQALTRG